MQVVKALLEFAQTMQQLPEILLDSGVDQDIVPFLQPSIVGKRSGLLRLESLLA